MSPRIPIALLLFITLFAACGKTEKKPAATEYQSPPGKAEQPHTLLAIGREASDMVGLWVLNLSEVETEESADSAAVFLTLMEDQFDLLLERAQKLPKLSPEEFKRIDVEIDQLISNNASGLEPERRRIFLLPDQIKNKILPIHDRLLKKFRAMSRAIAQNSMRAAG